MQKKSISLILVLSILSLIGGNVILCLAESETKEQAKVSNVYVETTNVAYQGGVSMDLSDNELTILRQKFGDNDYNVLYKKQEEIVFAMRKGLKYLQNKYNETFIILDIVIEDTNETIPRDVITFCLEDNQDINYELIIYHYQNRDEFCDNFYGSLIRFEYDKEIETILTMNNIYIDGCYTSFYTLLDDYQSYDIEYLDKRTNIFIQGDINDENFIENIKNEVLSILSNHNIKGEYGIYIVDDISAYGTNTCEYQVNLTHRLDLSHCVVEIIKI